VSRSVSVIMSRRGSVNVSLGVSTSVSTSVSVSMSRGESANVSLSVSVSVSMHTIKQVQVTSLSIACSSDLASISAATPLGPALLPTADAAARSRNSSASALRHPHLAVRLVVGFPCFSCRHAVHALRGDSSHTKGSDSKTWTKTGFGGKQ
jgi:hypothetical protein